MSRPKRITLVVVAVAVITLAAIATAKYAPQAVLDEIAVIGTYASVFGFIFVLVQLSAIKKAATLTKEAADETRVRVFAFLTAIDVAKLSKTVHEIQIYNRDSKFESSIMRMQELKAGLTDILHSERLKAHIKSSQFQRHIADLSVNLSSLEKEVHSPSKTLDVVGLNKSLESISNALDILHSKTKHQEIGI